MSYFPYFHIPFLNLLRVRARLVSYVESLLSWKQIKEKKKKNQQTKTRMNTRHDCGSTEYANEECNGRLPGGPWYTAAHAHMRKAGRTFCPPQMQNSQQHTHTHKMKESTFPLTQEVTRTCECSVEKRDEASRQDNNPTRPLRCPRAKNMSVKRR